jgi:hypothetical protein
MRTIVAINSFMSFRLGEAAHSKHDVEAVASRFLFIHTPKNQEVLARSLFDYKKFVEGRAIAEHALWLFQMRDRKAERFGVETQSYNEIAYGDFMNESVLSWMHEQLLRKTPGAAEMRSDTPACFVARGCFYVHVKRMLENWGEQTRYKPKHLQILEAVKIVSENEDVRIRIGKHRDSFYVVKTEMFRDYVLRRQLDTPENFDLMMRISTELPHQQTEYKLTTEERDERNALLRRFNLGEPQPGNDNQLVAE